MNRETPHRIYFLDLARGVAIFSMFFQHCMILHEKTAGEGDTILGNIFVLAGTVPAAPVFMVLLGTFLMKSTDNCCRPTLLRGVKLLLLGYLLNLVRFTIPLEIVGIDRSLYLPDESPLSLFLAFDILQLAGLSLLIIAFLKKYSSVPFLFPVLMVCILWFSPFLWGKCPHIPFFFPFWGTGKNVYFPLFPWIIYILLGMHVSRYLLVQELSGRLLRIFLGIGGVCICTGLLLFDVFPVGDYHRSGLSVHLVIIGFIFVWLPLCQVIIQKTPSAHPILQTLFFWSRHVTSVYCIQWILFGWSLLIFGVNRQDDYVAALIGLSVLIVTHFVVKSSKIQRMFSWV
jgi:uncharacterized membrane protein